MSFIHTYIDLYKKTTDLFCHTHTHRKIHQNLHEYDICRIIV